MKEVQTVYKQQGKLTEEILSGLLFVYQAPLLPALELIDNQSVTLLMSPSGRQVYQVIGSAGTRYYTCLTSSHYCSCPAFRFSVLKKEDYLLRSFLETRLLMSTFEPIQCKHVLAIKLSEAMEKVKTNQVTDNELATIIQEME